MLNNVPLSEDEEDVSCNVESLFTNILTKETIDFICNEIYNRKKSKPNCKQSVFKKLLYKLTKECTFSIAGRLCKQIDGVAMVYSLSDSVGLFYEQDGKSCHYPLKLKVYC